ncbi:MAG: DNA primase [Proteobacteria bacterium]|nr:DNA primase [Pseudomonadota bacterium]
MFSKSTLDEIRERVSIASLIGERMPLKRAGRNFKGLCPFHNEKTPSFSVSDEKGIYHCFGCGAGGDCFQFLMQFDGVGFADAVEQLAAKVGVTIERSADPRQAAQEDERQKRRRQLLRVNDIAREFFSMQLADEKIGAEARAYLQARGIKDEILKQHFLGFADKSWESLAGHLRSKGVPDALAVELGLIKRRDGGGAYDFFRNRVIFPIVSPRGEVIGFGGRAIGSGEAGEPQAKYLNSPDSPIYHKSGSVYGLDRSAAAIRSLDRVILVEGYMDFIALHQSGVENVAAPLGTALTEGHVSALARYTRNMVLVFDGDEAGSRAAIRSLGVFVDSGIMPRVALLPSGEDPDSLVRKEGAEAFRARIERARPLFDHFVELTVAKTGLDSAGKVAALQRIAPMMARVDDPVESAILRQHLARRLDVEERVIAGAAGAQRKRGALAPQERGRDAAAESSVERLLIRTMLAHPETAPAVFGSIAAADFADEWCRTAAGMLAAAAAGGRAPDVNALIAGIEDDQLASALRALAIGEPGLSDEEAANVAADCARRMAARPVQTRIEAINEEIIRAQDRADDGRIVSLLAEKGELVSRIHRRAGTGER